MAMLEAINILQRVNVVINEVTFSFVEPVPKRLWWWPSSTAY